MPPSATRGRSGDSGDLENVDGRRTALQASEGPELIEDVYLGTQYVDGIVFEPTAEKVAA